MAIGAAMVWRVRVGGSDNNGAGYDSTVAGAGTDYSQQDTAQLALTDLATSGAGSTTLTSATGGFTAAMIGNVIQIRAGTNFQKAHYVITGHTDTNTVTLDRTPTSGGAGSAGSGNVGGGYATIAPLSNGGGGGAPAVTSGLTAGNIVYIRGAGTDDPSAVDYTYTTYYTFAAGDAASGPIRWIGENGRPFLTTNQALIFYTGSYWHFSNLKIRTTGTTFSTLGLINFGTASVTRDVRFDQNGNDIVLQLGGSAYACEFKNSGATTAGTNAGFLAAAGDYNNVVSQCYFQGIRGPGVKTSTGCGITVKWSVFNDCDFGVDAAANAAQFIQVIDHCTFYNNNNDGVRANHATGNAFVRVTNSLFISNGRYGLNAAVGTTAVNDRRIYANYNAYYNNTTAAVNGITAGANDVTLTGDPFTSAAGEDFSLNNTASAGAACRNAAWLSSFLGASTSQYLDIGAARHVDPAGGSGGSAVAIFGG